MKPGETTDNKIFKYAFLGALLFIAAIGFTISNFSNIAVFELSSTTIASTLSLSSLSLLFKAIKDDKHRLRQPI